MSRNISTWKPDGAGWRARRGVLTPDDDAVPESECWTMAPGGVSVHAARVPLGDLQTYADPPGPDNATEQLASLPLHGSVFAFTTSSYLLGTTGEQALVARLEKRSHGIPVLLPTIAAAAAFRALAVGRIALFHSPWFTDEVVQQGVAVEETPLITYGRKHHRPKHSSRPSRKRFTVLRLRRGLPVALNLPRSRSFRLSSLR